LSEKSRNVLRNDNATLFNHRFSGRDLLTERVSYVVLILGVK